MGPNKSSGYGGSDWHARFDLGAYATWAWGSELDPTPQGLAHFQGPKNTHYCAQKVVSTLPPDSFRSSELQYRQFKKLGRCSDATGATGTLEFCDPNSNYTGALPEGCNSDGTASLRGRVGDEEINLDSVSFNSSGVWGEVWQGPITHLEYSGPQGVVMKFDGTETTPKEGFVRLPIGDEDGVVYCVTDASAQEKEYAWTQATLQIVRLGACSEAPDIDGEVSLCL